MFVKESTFTKALYLRCVQAPQEEEAELVTAFVHRGRLNHQQMRVFLKLLSVTL